MALKLTADPERELASIEYWIMGSLNGISLYDRVVHFGGNGITAYYNYNGYGKDKKVGHQHHEEKCFSNGYGVKRNSKKTGKKFYGCSNYPTCDFAAPNVPTGEKCPECGGYILAGLAFLANPCVNIFDIFPDIFRLFALFDGDVQAVQQLIDPLLLGQTGIKVGGTSVVKFHDSTSVFQKVSP